MFRGLLVGFRESSADQDGDADAGRARRRSARFPRRLCAPRWRGPARAVFDRVAPDARVGERRYGEVERAVRENFDRKACAFEGVGWPRGGGRFGEEEEPIEGGFGRGRALLFRRIVDARGKAGAAEARAVWVRRIAKRRREQVMNALAFGGHGRLVASIRASTISCSARVSTSFMVETTYWASTRRQTRRAYGRNSDDSLACVQVVDDIHEAGHGADFFGGRGAEGEVWVCEPSARGRFVAADDCVEGAEEADEEDA